VLSSVAAELGFNSLADDAGGLVGLLVGSGQTGADGPSGLVSQNDVAQLSRLEELTSELQSRIRIPHDVFRLKENNQVQT
jgi:hypothetical protein